jgi:hypothetical protein
MDVAAAEAAGVMTLVAANAGLAGKIGALGAVVGPGKTALVDPAPHPARSSAASAPALVTGNLRIRKPIFRNRQE